MIILDESKLSKGTLAMIGHDYGMEFDYKEYNQEDYEEFIDDVVERFLIDVDTFSERLVMSILNNIHNAFNLD